MSGVGEGPGAPDARGGPVAPRRPAAGASGGFPPGFLWGAATSAFQVEGSPLADGAGPSDWHAFAHAGGIRGGRTGDAACDHYRLWRRDVALMRELGLTAYRFSLAWGRVLPEGRGAVNRPGLDFYERLVDALLAAGIAPCATLFHWDLPLALAERGGWAEPDTVGRFGDYADAVGRVLGDRVPMWATINEPWVIVDAGYLHGVHPPGRRDPAAAGRVSRHLLLAHGTAVRALRAAARSRVGIVLNLEPKDPATADPADRAAAARADAYMNRQFLDPLLGGPYPAELREAFGAAWPELSRADRRLLGAPIDFLGVNYYTRGVVRHDAAAGPLRAARVRQVGAPHTELDWEVRPEGLTALLLRLAGRRADLPLYVTENGAAFADPDRPQGEVVEDPLRVDYIRRHLLAAREALRAGVDLRGWFVWSLLDNLEWAQGYARRFGIVHVDYATQRRTPKRSALFYRRVARSGGRSLTGAPPPASGAGHPRALPDGADRS